MKNGIQQTIGVIKSLYRTTKQRLLFFVSGQFKKTEGGKKKDDGCNCKKNGLSWWRGLWKQHDTRLLKTMDDYKINFDLDSKIAWNRHRLRELFEMYKKIENYYALFFAFLGFIGVFYFDFIVLLSNKFSVWFLFTTITTTIGLILVLYYMTKIMFTEEWHQDSTPQKIYIKLFDEMTMWYGINRNSFNLIEIDKSVRESYLASIEKSIDVNYGIYKERKRMLSKILKIIFITLIIYSFNIIHFKLLTKMEAEKPKPEIETTNENLNVSRSLSDYLTLNLNSKQIDSCVFDSVQENRIREIIREELDRNKKMEIIDDFLKGDK